MSSKIMSDKEKASSTPDTPAEVKTSQDVHLAIRIVCFLSFSITLATGYAISMDASSQAYDLRVSPPGVFFAIWGLIYICFGLTSLYALIKDVWKLSSWLLYAAWQVTAGLWIFSFTRINTAGLIASFILIVGLLVEMEALWTTLIRTEEFNGWIAVFTHNTYALCTGWLIAACNLNFGILLTELAGMSYSDQFVMFWVMVSVMCLLFYLRHFTTARFVSSIGILLSTAWGITGAIIASTQAFPRDDAVRNLTSQF